MNGIVAVYSYSGYSRAAAKIAAEVSGWPLYELEVTPPYSGGYWKMVARVGAEFLGGSERKVTPVPEIIEPADRVILAMPTWWFTYARPLHPWVRQADWQGRGLYALLTCGGNPGRSRQDLEQDSGGALADLLVVRRPKGAAVPEREEIAAWVTDVVMKQ